MRNPGLLRTSLFSALLALGAGAVYAAEPTTAELAAGVEANKVTLDTLWVLFAGCLVFFMQAGFAYLEGGLTRSKNTCNIMMKNLMDFCTGTLAYWAVGFGIMFGAGNMFFGTSGFFLVEKSPETFASLDWTIVPLGVKFFFQLVFAAAAATIVSGAMAERTKFSSYFIYSIVISAVIYPVVGKWIWGGGWLAELGMWDFAGSTVVHSTGGWIALMGAIIVGPRLGKYGKDGKPRAIPGHNLPMAAMGAFILWLGWFGFNPGSLMAADPDALAHIFVVTNMAAVTGAIAAMATSWIVFKKPDISMALNGALGGLVAITAGCAFVSPVSGLIIGVLGGVLVVASVLFLDRMHVDDPVGAISVHGTCGALGTICVGLFAQDVFSPGTTGNGLLFGGGVQLLVAQLIGVGAVFAFLTVTGGLLFLTIKHTIGLRVSAEEEEEGLDISEHGLSAYPDFEQSEPHSIGLTDKGAPGVVGSPAKKLSEEPSLG